MTDEEAMRLRRENDYLKARVAQLQGDVDDLGAQVSRLTQALERTIQRRAVGASPDPLGGGQSA